MKKIITIIGIFGLILVQAQKVGINTDDPKATLDIKSEGNANDTKAFKITNSDNIEIVTVTDDGKVGIITGEQHIKIGTGASTSGYTLDVGLNDDGVNFINNSTARGFNFGNKAGNLLHLNHNGNVGIGTANPATKLDVRGQVRIGTLNDVADTDNVKVLVTGADGVVKTKSISSLQTAVKGQIITHGRIYVCNHKNVGVVIYGLGVVALCEHISPGGVGAYIWRVRGYSFDGVEKDTWTGWAASPRGGYISAGRNLMTKFAGTRSQPIAHLLFYVIDDSQYKP